MTKFWSGLTEREQLLMLLCVVSVFLFLLYVSVIDPISREKAAAQRALDAQKQTYGRILDMASSAKDGTSSDDMARSEQLPLREAATAAARFVGIAVSRIQPGSDNRITFWIDEASTQDMSKWLLFLENEHNWTPSKVSLNKNLQGNTLRGQFEFAGAGQ